VSCTFRFCLFSSFVSSESHIAVRNTQTLTNTHTITHSHTHKHTITHSHTHTITYTLTHTHIHTESNQTRSRASFLHVVALRYSGERTKMTSLRRQGVAERARSSGWRTSLGIVLASNSCTFPATRTAVYVLWTLMRTILSQEMESGF